MLELPQTRQSLIIRLADQSQDAWIEFVEIYEQAIVGFARRKGLQEADALDLTQEVMRALEKKVVDWKLERQHGSFRGWLFRVARNMAVDKLKSRTRNPVTGASVLAEVASNSSVAEEFDIDFAREVFSWAIEQARPSFAKSTWDAFWLTAMEKQSPAEVAERTGLSVGGVYAAKFRVISKLQKLVRKFRPVSGTDEFSAEESRSIEPGGGSQHD